MNNQVLIDTNILIYAIDRDSKFHDEALDLLNQPEVELFTTSKNISEFLVVLTRDPESQLSSLDCLDLMEAMLVDFSILFPSKISLEIMKRLIQKYQPKGLWIHDIEIASIGLAHGIPKIATKNTRDFQRIEEIEVLSKW